MPENRNMIVGAVGGASIGLVTGLTRADEKCKGIINITRTNYIDKVYEKNFSNVYKCYRTAERRAEAFARIGKQAADSFENSSALKEVKKEISKMKFKNAVVYSTVACAIGIIFTSIMNYINRNNPNKKV